MSILGQYGVNLASTWVQPEVNLGSTWVSLGSTLGLHGVNLGSTYTAQPRQGFRGPVFAVKDAFETVQKPQAALREVHDCLCEPERRRR